MILCINLHTEINIEIAKNKSINTHQLNFNEKIPKF
jgi:hypothetical protein